MYVFLWTTRVFACDCICCDRSPGFIEEEYIPRGFGVENTGSFGPQKMIIKKVMINRQNH